MPMDEFFGMKENKKMKKQMDYDEDQMFKPDKDAKKKIEKIQDKLSFA